MANRDEELPEGATTVAGERASERRWTILSNHGVVLFYLAANPSSTLRETSEAAGITERQVARIVRDLVDGGLVTVERRGRRNVYTVNPDAYMRHPTVRHVKLSRIIEAVRRDDLSSVMGADH